jgi:hypothetical protein
VKLSGVADGQANARSRPEPGAGTEASRRARAIALYATRRSDTEFGTLSHSVSEHPGAVRLLIRLVPPPQKLAQAHAYVPSRQVLLRQNEWWRRDAASVEGALRDVVAFVHGAGHCAGPTPGRATLSPRSSTLCTSAYGPALSAAMLRALRSASSCRGRLAPQTDVTKSWRVSVDASCLFIHATASISTPSTGRSSLGCRSAIGPVSFTPRLATRNLAVRALTHVRPPQRTRPAHHRRQGQDATRDRPGRPPTTGGTRPSRPAVSAAHPSS